MRSKIFSLILLFALIFPAFSIPNIFAELYKWTDKDSNVFFSDSPQSGVDAKEVKPKTGQRFDVPEGEKKAQPSSKVRPFSDIRVIVYMTDWCPYCRKAREYLKSIGANFIEYDIDKDKFRHDEMLKKSGGSKGVPLIDVEGIIIRGYNPEAIKAAIESRRK